jgi:hypothetical protein
MKRNDEAIIECYTELFFKSNPSADFKELMDNAEINEEGQKVIDFMAYEIDEELYKSIVESMIDKYKFKGIKKQQFRTTIALGCSPKFKIS